VNPPRPEATRNLRLTTVKAVHTLIWLSIESCMAYVLVSGFQRRSDRRAAAAAVVVAAECAVFVGYGFRCPLTDLAESLGADDGSVTDIYLPRFVAHSLPVIHIPVIAVAAGLHARNLLERRPSLPGGHPERGMRAPREG
jgi:hypothetical protein